MKKSSVIQAQIIIRVKCERAVRTHKQQAHNAKGIEKTFAERENIRLFIRRHEVKYGKLSSYSDGKKLHSVDMDKVDFCNLFSSG